MSLMNPEEVKHHLLNVNSTNEEERNQSLAFFVENKVQKGPQFFVCLLNIAQEPDKTNPSILQAYIFIQKMLFPAYDNMITSIKAMWDEVDEADHNRLFELCHDGIFNYPGIICTNCIDILVDIFRLVDDSSVFVQIIQDFTKFIVDPECQNRSILIDFIIKLCNEKGIIQFESIQQLANFANDFIDNPEEDEKLKLPLFIMLNAIMSRDFEEFNNAECIGKLIIYMKMFLENAEQKSDEILIEMICEHFKKLFIRTYAKPYFHDSAIREFLNTGIGKERSFKVRIEMLKLWTALVSYEVSQSEKQKNSMMYDSELFQIFKNTPKYIQKYSYPLETCFSSNFFVAYITDQSFMEYIINTTTENDFSEESIETMLQIATLLSVFAKIEPTFVSQIFESFLSREVQEYTPNEIYANLIVLLSICTENNSYLLKILSKRLENVFSSVKSDFEPINELAIRILCYMNPVVYSKIYSDISAEAFIGIISDLYSSPQVNSNPNMTILLTRVVRNYFNLEVARKEQSTIRSLNDMVFGIADDYKSREGALSLGVYEAACMLKSEYIASVVKIFCYDSDEEKANIIINECISCFIEMHNPQEGITESDKLRMIDCSLQSIKYIVSNCLLITSMKRILEKCLEIVGVELNPTFIEIISILVSKMFSKAEEQLFTTLVGLKDEAIGSQIPEVIDAGIKLQAALFSKFPQELREFLPGEIEKIDSMLENQRYLIKSYSPLFDMLTMMLTNVRIDVSDQTYIDAVFTPLFRIYSKAECFGFSNDSEESIEYSSHLIASIYNNFAQVKNVYPGGLNAFLKLNSGSIFKYIEIAINLNILTTEVLVSFTNFIDPGDNNRITAIHMWKCVVDVLILCKIDKNKSSSNASSIIYKIFNPNFF